MFRPLLWCSRAPIFHILLLFAAFAAGPALAAYLPRHLIQNSTSTLLHPRQVNELWEGWATDTTIITVYTTASDYTAPAATSSSIPGTVTVTEYPNSMTPSNVVSQTTLVTVGTGGPDTTQASQVTVTTTWSPCSLAVVSSTSIDFSTAQTLVVTDSNDVTTTLQGTQLSNYLSMCPTPTPESTTTTSGIREEQTASPEQREQRICLADDANQKEGSGLKPTHTQTVTLYVMAIMLLGTLVGWHLWFVRVLAYPLKMVVVSWHELGHAAALIVSGIKIASVDVDPTFGGATRTSNESEMWYAEYPMWVLPMGFIFSSIIGGVFVFCGFDTYASKIASFWLGVSFLSTIVFAAGITKLVVLAALGILIGLWFIDHGSGLRYYILLMGIMSNFYWIMDTMDDKLHGKKHPCCCMMQHEELLRMGRRVPIAALIGIYALFSFIILVAFILAALAVWRETPYAMYCQSQNFIPT